MPPRSVPPSVPPEAPAVVPAILPANDGQKPACSVCGTTEGLIREFAAPGTDECMGYYECTACEELEVADIRHPGPKLQAELEATDRGPTLSTAELIERLGLER